MQPHPGDWIFNHSGVIEIAPDVDSFEFEQPLWVSCPHPHSHLADYPMRAGDFADEQVTGVFDMTIRRQGHR
jgi:hypothetical protein